MKIDVSNGEVVDRFTILMLKAAKLSKANNITQLGKVQDALSSLTIQPEFIALMKKIDPVIVDQLMQCNETLWNLEDRIREEEKKGKWNRDFIQIARNIYFTNDERSKLKKRINDATQSDLTEEKLYTEY